ncbi:MAG: DapH/DapD/GlmU-related protein [Deltaproteobacteria bacterium]|nr:DapH/DapD/GlmU-related protein [Deltaproteobacteria bacterium]
MNSVELQRQGLLVLGENVMLDERVIFLPHDQTGEAKVIKVGNNVRIMPSAIICGGVTIGDGAVIEAQVILGQPEYGYAIGEVYPGKAKQTDIAEGVILRAGSIVYSGVSIGPNTTIGHRTLVRTDTQIGSNTQLGHNMTIERSCRIGDWIRCTGLTHITSSTVLEDRVFLGALVGTVNDKAMIWKQERVKPELIPPYFEYGCTVGTGAKIAAGVRIGRMAMVGTGSVVTKDVAPNAIVMGVPAKFYKMREEG